MIWALLPIATEVTATLPVVVVIVELLFEYFCRIVRLIIPDVRVGRVGVFLEIVTDRAAEERHVAHRVGHVGVELRVRGGCVAPKPAPASCHRGCYSWRIRSPPAPPRWRRQIQKCKRQGRCVRFSAPWDPPVVNSGRTEQPARQHRTGGHYRHCSNTGRGPVTFGPILGGRGRKWPIRDFGVPRRFPRNPYELSRWPFSVIQRLRNRS